MFDIGGGELLLIIFMILLLFGPKKIPEIARALGKGMNQLRKAQAEFQRNVNGLTAEIESAAGISDDQPSLFPRMERKAVASNEQPKAISETTTEQEAAIVPQPAAHTIAREQKPDHSSASATGDNNSAQQSSSSHSPTHT